MREKISAGSEPLRAGSHGRPGRLQPPHAPGYHPPVSRAFVDEDAAPGRDEDVAPLKPPLPPGARNYVTPVGAARLAAELRALQQERRPALAEAAREESPPGPARRALGECDRRIAYLSHMQALQEIVAPAGQPDDRVRFGATVAIRQSPGRERTLRIVGVDEVDTGSGDVSWISPIARALMGARVGDTVRCKLPAGPCRLRVLTISYR
jgi:transcription elongation factor GreB